MRTKKKNENDMEENLKEVSSLPKMTTTHLLPRTLLNISITTSDVFIIRHDSSAYHGRLKQIACFGGNFTITVTETAALQGNKNISQQTKRACVLKS
jgi:hypothetical protein